MFHNLGEASTDFVRCPRPGRQAMGAVPFRKHVMLAMSEDAHKQALLVESGLGPRNRARPSRLLSGRARGGASGGELTCRDVGGLLLHKALRGACGSWLAAAAHLHHARGVAGDLDPDLLDSDGPL